MDSRSIPKPNKPPLLSRQYTDERYLPATTAFRQRAGNRGSLGADLVAWQADLAKHGALRFGSATVQQQGEQYFSHVQVFLDALDPDAVEVELYADVQKDAAPITQTMNRSEHLVGATNGFTYSAVVPAIRPAADYTPRLIPQHVGAWVPLEAPFILWHDAPSWR